MPVLAFFLPLPLAIGVTALAHLSHIAIKLGMTYRSINYSIGVRFGAVALLFAIPGAYALKYVSKVAPFYEYTLGVHIFEMTYLKFAVGALLIFVAVLDSVKRNVFRYSELFINAALSGFIGGFTGNQGAFRSLYLLRQGLSKEAFIATTALISLLVDVVRLIFYYSLFPLWREYVFDLLPAVIGSVIGVFVGNFIIKSVNMGHIHKLVLVLLYVFGLAFIVGVL